MPEHEPTLGAGHSLILERDAELAALEALLGAACQGEGRLAVVEGPAGIGKTRLLSAAREIALASGLEVLNARAGELEEEFAFGVVRQLFEVPLASATQTPPGSLSAPEAWVASRLRRLSASASESNPIPCSRPRWRRARAATRCISFRCSTRLGGNGWRRQQTTRRASLRSVQVPSRVASQCSSGASRRERRICSARPQYWAIGRNYLWPLRSPDSI